MIVARRLAILTSDALALRRALNASRVALAIPFEAMRILAIASLGMNNGLSFGNDLLLKSVGIVGFDTLYSCMNIVVVKTIIFAV